MVGNSFTMSSTNTQSEHLRTSVNITTNPPGTWTISNHNIGHQKQWGLFWDTFCLEWHSFFSQLGGHSTVAGSTGNQEWQENLFEQKQHIKEVIGFPLKLFLKLVKQHQYHKKNYFKVLGLFTHVIAEIVTGCDGDHTFVNNSQHITMLGFYLINACMDLIIFYKVIDS